MDKMVYEDAKKEFNLNSQTGFGVDGDHSQQVADFESVRGSFESNSFVQEVLKHIERKTALGNKIRKNWNPFALYKHILLSGKLLICVQKESVGSYSWTDCSL